MIKEINLKKEWENVLHFFSDKFGEGDVLDLDAILYLIGVREFGKGDCHFKKEEKINLMHIAICCLLEPYGYYEFDFMDEQGWPHYKNSEKIPYLKPGEQTIFMKKSIIKYFKEKVN